MASLEGNKIKDTYQGLLKTTDNAVLDENGRLITDGAGNSTGVSLNNQGDVSATGTVSFGSLKDTAEDITITKFVDEADGISSNDNDTSIPTSAAVKDYVDSNVTAQDLDISDGTNTGSVDLDSQSLTFTGDAGVSATVSGQTVTFDSSALQANIDAEASTRAAADTTLQTNITAEASARSAADTTLQENIDAEEAARISADSAINTSISTEQTARQAADAILQDNIDAEEAARIAADNNIQDSIDAETAARVAADSTLQGNIDTEASTRSAADSTLQTNIDNETSARQAADTALQTQITSNDTDISGLDTRLTSVESNQSATGVDVSSLETRMDAAEANITSNDSDISGLDTRLTTAEGDITALESGKQDVSEKGQANGYASLDSNGTVPVSQLPESVTGALIFEGLWDASTNTPTLPDPTLHKGDYYKVSVEGVYLGETFHVGDWALSDGVAWQHIHTQETISDVFGREGSITAQEGDYSAFYPLLSDLAATDANVLANTTKLAGIEDGADVTDATNVAAAGALMSDTAALDDLADVNAPSPTNGQVLSYNGTSGEWQAAAAAAAPVDSVNGQTGVVVLDADDIDDTSTTNKFVVQSQIDKLAGIEAGADVTDSTNVTSALATISVTSHSDVTDAGSGAIITSAERTKLEGIEASADVTDAANVTSALNSISVTQHSDVTSAGSGAIITAAERTKLEGIETGADVTDATNVTTALGSISATALSDISSVGSGAIITSAERTQLQAADAAYTVSVIGSNTTAVKDVLYVFTASLTLTLPSSPSAGDKVKFSNMSGTTTPVIARNGSNIMGLAEDLTVDVDNFGAELIYSGATKGWVLI